MKPLSITLQELAKLTGSEFVGDPNYPLMGAAPLEDANMTQVSFYVHERYLPLMEATLAGVVFVDPLYNKKPDRQYLIHPQPGLAFQKALAAFAKKLGLDESSNLTAFTGIHPMSVIHASAHISSNVSVGPNAVIDKNVHIGTNTHIGANCSIGPNVTIGDGCWIHPNVTIREQCKIGSHVIIQPGAVIGSCGFGFVQDHEGRHQKLSQVGIVVIEDDVEIGANTTIDRARFDKTRIGKGTKIDNLVQIAHNVEIGNDCIIVSQVGIAGSTKIGNRVILMGKVAVNGHITIADDVTVGACSGISKSVTEPGQYGGSPILPAKEFRRQTVFMRQLGKFFDQIKELADRISRLEKS